MHNNSHFSILVSGTPEGNIKPTRGIRQGDPLSPYFISYAEYVGRYLHFMSNILKLGLGTQTAKEVPKILYLKFADDCIIFSKATKKATRTISTSWKTMREFLVNY